MSRKPRKKSNTGIYHVMLRGINRQTIFFNDNDYLQMQWTLVEASRHRGPDGKLLDSNECTIYAYCIMGNHVHILIREGNKNISEIMKKIEDRYVYYYNKDKIRVGHLFQARFRSEPVDDEQYFHVLLRYIHRNPVKAGECEKPEQYPWSSWSEYLQTCRNDVTVILPRAFKTIYHYYKPKDLVEWVNMDVEDKCMDIDSDNYGVTDMQAWDIISGFANESNPEKFKQLSLDFQLSCIEKAVNCGISFRQAARLSAVTFHSIRKYINTRKQLENHSSNKSINKSQENKSGTFSSIKGSDPLIEESSVLDRIPGIKPKHAETLQHVLDIFDEKTHITSKDISEKLGISDSMSRREIRFLTANGFIELDENEKGRRYVKKILRIGSGNV